MKIDRFVCPSDIRRVYLYARRMGILVDPHSAAVAIRSVGDYSGTRSTYVQDITSSMMEYMRGYLGMAVAKGIFRSAIATAFVDAFETGYVEGQGGEEYDPEPDDSDWLATRQEQEMEYINSLFVTMKEIISSASIEEPVTDTDIVAFADDRAATYARTLDGIYAQGKLRGRKNIMLGLEGADGNESCSICQKYKGVYHRSKWWVAHDLVPSPGNENYECGGYRCQHTLQDRDGNVWAGSLE